MRTQPHPQHQPFCRVQAIAPLILVALLGSDLAWAKSRLSRGKTATGASKLESPRPEIGSAMPAPDRWAFRAAFNAAVKRIDGRQSCGDLFADLDLKGIEALSAARYEPARQPVDMALCEGGVAAVTSVHGRRTRLCYRFKVLSQNDRAAILIHEALHVAGLSEWPHDPEAPTSREITEMVKGACAL